MTKDKKPTVLMILDGFGVGSDSSKSAIAKASKPNLDKYISSYPITTLGAAGEKVGLPTGQMGNSEVGHLNIGAGRIVYQDLSKISRDIISGAQVNNRALHRAMSLAKKKKKTLHLFGLLSDGGVHSHMDHLFALLNMSLLEGVEKVAIHCFLDGRDVSPDSGIDFLRILTDYINMLDIGNISTISGRYYAMDRDNRWDRVELAYDALTGSENPKVKKESNAIEAIKRSYEDGVQDEFVIPTAIEGGSFVEDGDSIIMFNFRPDRAREISRAFVDENFDGFKRKKVLKNLTYVTMTEYDKTLENVLVAYPKEDLKNTLGQWVAKKGLSQLRIAETEKYAHVTFFFNGGVEVPFENEDRILIPSPKVDTYDLKPEMSAHEVTKRVIEEIDKDKYDLIILNYANPDMVGHTGNMEATVQAIEALDKCCGQVVESVLSKGGQVIITSDHGNADLMLDKDGKTVTAHSLNPVPLIYISNSPRPLREGGFLSDIAPTVLEILGLPAPFEMTGESLIKGD